MAFKPSNERISEKAERIRPWPFNPSKRSPKITRQVSLVLEGKKIMYSSSVSRLVKLMKSSMGVDDEALAEIFEEEDLFIEVLIKEIN